MLYSTPQPSRCRRRKAQRTASVQTVTVQNSGSAILYIIQVQVQVCENVDSEGRVYKQMLPTAATGRSAFGDAATTGPSSGRGSKSQGLADIVTCASRGCQYLNSESARGPTKSG